MPAATTSSHNKEPGVRLGLGEGQEQGRARVQDPAVEPVAALPRVHRRPFRIWAVEFASALLGFQVEFWYDQFLAKPPARSADALAPGRGLLGPQPRRQGHHLLDAVPRRRRRERLHALHRRRPPRRRARTAPPTRCRATCSSASPTRARTVACPIPVGSVTFHHSKTPHMTTANTTDSWRRILTQHLRVVGSEGRRRPLPVEGLRQPVHRRAHQSAADDLVPRRATTRGVGCDARRADRLAAPAAP